jgi:adenylate kinase
MNVLIVGPQGAGKGTQAQRIAQEYGVPHLATGDLYRAEVANGTDLGLLVGPLLQAGQLVPDEITIPIVRGQIEDADNGFVLDGYPRNLAQAEALDEMLEEVARTIGIVFAFYVPDRQQLVERLLKRAAEESRPDDTLEVIERRLRDYDEKTEPLIEYYRSTRGNVVGVHADRSVDEVFHEIEDALNAVAAR